MTTMTINPSFTAKTASVTGIIAVGEKVLLYVFGVDTASLEHLRVRVRFAGADVARFPMTEADSWGVSDNAATGTIDLNTVELRNVFDGLDDHARMTCVLVVEDNGGVNNLYATTNVTVKNWPVSGDQVPVSLGTWTDQVEEIRGQILDLQQSVAAVEVFTGHNHNGVNSFAVQHSDLSGSGTKTHDQIDGKLDSLDSAMSSYAGTVQAHVTGTENPHGVTKAQVGLANVNNTSDASKPVSTAVAAALAVKLEAEDLAAHTVLINNPHGVTKTQVGLGNVDNTSDANKPVSTAVSYALAAKAAKSTVDNHVANNNDPHGSLAKLAVGLAGVNTPTTIDGLFSAMAEVLAVLKGEA